MKRLETFGDIESLYLNKREKNTFMLQQKIICSKDQVDGIKEKAE